MNRDERIQQEKITEYDVLYQQFFDKESPFPVDQDSADILKKQADALREQAELLDLAEDLIMVLDMEHRILFWNRGAEKKYGWSRGDVRGENVHYLLNTRFPQCLKEIEKTLIACGRWEGELIQARRDGCPILVESRWTLRCNERGKPLAILEINNDISQRKHAEAMLKKTLEELEGRIQERTADLQKVNAELHEEIVERKRMEEVLKKQQMELKIKTKNLEELNAALKVLLKKREEDKNELEENVLSNVKNMVLPYVKKIRMTALDATQLNYINILETNLNEITSSFHHKLTSRSLNLTPREVQVAALIKDGRTTKEIAELMNVCPGAVALHRNHIRKKLGLNKKKVNLASHLSSLP
ncbi:PAS domain S-box protein [Syntrophus aciditrophicus]|uniref:GerE transcriptional regulator n=1 Tax=Syntrophus aciditrophicus (strain SB) TaxID=56780 RepID=Q2LQ27_SYNAS|nr:PAS domain S-box protein [Syntrophus aciditrophicus]ABC76113.1 gerE transcriptional regulator [Syntrophus aciditrophicus SB]